MMAPRNATLADYVAELKYQDLPPEVLERAKVLTLDFRAAHPPPRALESTPPSIELSGALAADARATPPCFRRHQTCPRRRGRCSTVAQCPGPFSRFDEPLMRDSSLQSSAPVGAGRLLRSAKCSSRSGREC